MRMYVYISFDTESKFVLSTLTSKLVVFCFFDLSSHHQIPPPPPPAPFTFPSLTSLFRFAIKRDCPNTQQRRPISIVHTPSNRHPHTHTLSLFSFVSSALSLSLSLSLLFLPYPLSNLAHPFLLDLTLVFPLTLTLIHMLRSTAMSLSKSNLDRGTFRDVLLSHTKKVTVCLFIASNCMYTQVN